MGYILPLMNVADAIRLRRSIKPEFMKSDPVDRTLLMQMFEAANWAPSHGHTEPWRFIVFERDARKELFEAVLSTMANDGQDTIPLDDPRRHTMAAKMLKPPVTIALICATSPNANIVEHEEIASVAMAVQNMHLVARSLGLAAFWTSGNKAFHPKMAKFLNIEAPSRCPGFLYVGWPEIEWPDAKRRPVAEKITWRG